mgnify:CR=1 FL=1
MRPMTWMPIPLASGGTLAHAVIPSDMTAGEAEIVCTAIRALVRTPVEVKRTIEPRVETEKSELRTPTDLELEIRTVVNTERAAYYLNRKPQTLRGWACHDDGPLRPLRINGRLAWPVAELRRCVGLRT